MTPKYVSVLLHGAILPTMNILDRLARTGGPLTRHIQHLAMGYARNGDIELSDQP